MGPPHHYGLINSTHEGVLDQTVLKLKHKLNVRMDVNVSDFQWVGSYDKGWNDQVINFYNACRNIQLCPRPDHWKWLIISNFTVKSATFAKSPVQPNICLQRLFGVVIIFIDMQSFYGLHFGRGWLL